MKRQPWLLFIYQIPATPSTHRAYAWRKLKSLGALYLQNSICLLPANTGLERALDDLRADIGGRGGHAQLFHVVFSPEESSGLIKRFDTQSDDEYGEFLEKCGDLHAELRKERDRKHFTFGELEENEAELQKLRLWLPRIESRDFFGAPSRDPAKKALIECGEDLALFERETETASNSASGDDERKENQGS